jgi:hypothetical protein
MTLSSRDEVTIGEQGTSLGASTPDILIPVLPGTFRATEIDEQILDQGRRGPDALDFRALQGVGRSEITWEGNVQQGAGTDVALGKVGVGYLIENLFGGGATSVQIGSTGNYDHDLKLGTAKEYLTITHDTQLSGSNHRQFIDCRVQELQLRWNAGEGFLTYRVTLTGQQPTLVAGPSVTDQALDPWMGWHAQVTFSGSGSFARMISSEWTLRRTINPFYSGQNSQNFTDIYAGPLEVTCSMVFDYSVDTDMALFRSKNQAALANVFTIGTANMASERTFSIGSVVMDLGDGPAELDNSGENVTLGLVGRGLYSTSNGPMTGSAQNGPVEVRITQPIVSAY